MLVLDFLEMSQGHLCHSMKNTNLLEKKQKTIFSNCTVTDCNILLVKFTVGIIYHFQCILKDLILNLQLLILWNDGLVRPYHWFKQYISVSQNLLNTYYDPGTLLDVKR